MNTQTGAWLKSRDTSNPLLYGARPNDAHPVQHLYAWGYSQTGGFLVTYANAIHPLDVQANGKPMFDGYLIGMPVLGTPINQCSGAIPADDPRRLVHNTGVPVIRIMTSSDYLLAIAARQPDSDTDTEKFRNYEIAGAAHATPDELYYAAAPADIVNAGRQVPPMKCKEGPRSRFPFSHQRAARFPRPSSNLIVTLHGETMQSPERLTPVEARCKPGTLNRTSVNQQ